MYHATGRAIYHFVLVQDWNPHQNVGTARLQLREPGEARIIAQNQDGTVEAYLSVRRS